MTLVGALHNGDDILIGADTVGTDRYENLRYEGVSKLEVIEQWSVPMIWAWAGDGAAASELREWLALRTPFGAWGNLRVGVRMEIKRIVSERIKTATAAGQPDKVPLVVVFAGCIAGTLKIARFDGAGNVSVSVKQGQIDYEGAGALNAKQAGLLLGYLQGKAGIETEEEFRLVMDWAAAVTPDCGGPVEFKRITCKGIEDAP
jgi:hypothetical protein